MSGSLESGENFLKLETATYGSQMHLSMFPKCFEICSSLMSKLEDEVTISTHSVTSQNQFRSKSTVGLMLDGLAIDNMVVGGPAFNTGQLERGDVILEIDGKPVSADQLYEALRGDDVPGSSMTLTVKAKSAGKSGQIKKVVLTRMSSEVIADRHKIFELFTSIKDQVQDFEDSASLISTLDECILLWTKMTIDDTTNVNAITAGTVQLRHDCVVLVEELQLSLSRAIEESQGTILRIQQQQVSALSAAAAELPAARAALAIARADAAAARADQSAASANLEAATGRLLLCAQEMDRLQVRLKEVEGSRAEAIQAREEIRILKEQAGEMIPRQHLDRVLEESRRTAAEADISSRAAAAALALAKEECAAARADSVTANLAAATASQDRARAIASEDNMALRVADLQVRLRAAASGVMRAHSEARAAAAAAEILEVELDRCKVENDGLRISIAATLEEAIAETQRAAAREQDVATHAATATAEVGRLRSLLQKAEEELTAARTACKAATEAEATIRAEMDAWPAPWVAPSATDAALQTEMSGDVTVDLQACLEQLEAATLVAREGGGATDLERAKEAGRGLGAEVKRLHDRLAAAEDSARKKEEGSRNLAMELERLRSRLSTETSSLRTAEERAQELSAELDRLRARVNTKDDLLRAGEERSRTATMELNHLRDQLSEQNAMLAALRADAATVAATKGLMVECGNSELLKARADAEAFAAAAAESASDAERWKRDVAALEAKVSSLSSKLTMVVSASEELVQAQREEVKQAQVDAEQLRRELAGARDELSRNSGDLTASQDQLFRIKEELERCRNELSQIKENSAIEIAKCQKELSAARDALPNQTLVQELTKEREDLALYREELVSLNKGFIQSQQDLVRCRQEISDYKQRLANVEEELSQCKAQCTTYSDELARCTAQLAVSIKDLELNSSELATCKDSLIASREEALQYKMELTNIAMLLPAQGMDLKLLGKLIRTLQPDPCDVGGGAAIDIHPKGPGNIDIEKLVKLLEELKSRAKSVSNVEGSACRTPWTLEDLLRIVQDVPLALDAGSGSTQASRNEDREHRNESAQRTHSPTVERVQDIGNVGGSPLSTGTWPTESYGSSRGPRQPIFVCPHDAGSPSLASKKSPGWSESPSSVSFKLISDPNTMIYCTYDGSEPSSTRYATRGQSPLDVVWTSCPTYFVAKAIAISHDGLESSIASRDFPRPSLDADQPHQTLSRPSFDSTRSNSGTPPPYGVPSIPGRIAGVGMLIQRTPVQSMSGEIGEGEVPSVITVLGLAPGGSADKDGRIRKGDRLVAVNGRDIRASACSDVLQLVAGPEGSIVDLRLSRQGAVFTVSLLRSTSGTGPRPGASTSRQSSPSSGRAPASREASPASMRPRSQDSALSDPLSLRLLTVRPREASRESTPVRGGSRSSGGGGGPISHTSGGTYSGGNFGGVPPRSPRPGSFSGRPTEQSSVSFHEHPTSVVSQLPPPAKAGGYAESDEHSLRTRRKP